jgi:glutathione S-transferase
MVEEHLHQIVEYEMFVHPAGQEAVGEWLDDALPWGVRSLVKMKLFGHFRKHLTERGIARHSPLEITAMGKRDLDALSTLLPDEGYLFGDRPALADASIFGQLALLLYPDYDAPLNQYAKTLPRLGAYCERIFEQWFPEEHRAAPPLWAAKQSA